jgi:hypothetical protein
MKKRVLPPGLRARRTRAGNVFYYLKTDSPKETPLGMDRHKALEIWRAHALERYMYMPAQGIASPVSLLQCFLDCEVPVRELRTRPMLVRQIKALEAYFLQHPPDALATLPDASLYLAHRGASYELRAGAEVRLFIHIWSWARHHFAGLPDCPWTSNEVGRMTEDTRLAELADAFRFYVPDAVRAEMAFSPGQLLRTLDDPGKRLDDNALICLSRRVARQLVLDGRGDLGRAMLRLDIASIRTAVSMEPDRHCLGQARLILGTCRRERLQTLRKKSR